MISGSGADEIFGGYSRYFSSLRNNIYGIFQSKKTDSNILKIIPYKYKDYFYKLANSKVSLACNQSGQSFSLIIKLFKDKNSKDFLLNYLESLFQNFKEDFVKFSSITVMQNDLKTYLPDNILSGFDKATMLNSVEGRVPYLDHRIVETFYSTNLDHNYFNDFSKNKKIIRDLFEMEILDKVFKRKKIGFDAPLVEWNFENSNYYKNDKNKNSMLTENLDLDFIDRNIDNTNLNQLVYTTNVYNNWLNSL